MSFKNKVDQRRWYSWWHWGAVSQRWNKKKNPACERICCNRSVTVALLSEAHSALRCSGRSGDVHIQVAMGFPSRPACLFTLLIVMKGEKESKQRHSCIQTASHFILWWMVWPEVGTGDRSGRRSRPGAVLASALPPGVVFLVGGFWAAKWVIPQWRLNLTWHLSSQAS